MFGRAVQEGHDFIVDAHASRAAVRINRDPSTENTRGGRAQGGRRAAEVRPFPHLTVLVFRVDLLDRPEHRFLEFLDLGVGRIVSDLLKFFVEIK